MGKVEKYDAMVHGLEVDKSEPLSMTPNNYNSAPQKKAPEVQVSVMTETS